MLTDYWIHIHTGDLSFKNSSIQLLLYCCALLFRKNHYNTEQRILNLERNPWIWSHLTRQRTSWLTQIGFWLYLLLDTQLFMGNPSPFYFQKCPTLIDKLGGHPNLIQLLICDLKPHTGRKIESFSAREKKRRKELSQKYVPRLTASHFPRPAHCG